MLQELYKVLEKPHASKYGDFIQKLILINVIINISVSFSNDIFHFSSTIVYDLMILEYITVGVFILELISRYISIGYDNKYKGLKGKIAFTFTPFIIIDILSLIPYFITSVSGDVLLARLVRFLRFFKILKLLRLRSTIKKVFSISTFASSSILIQIIVLFMFSLISIVVFSYVYNGEKTSLLIFLDPPSLAETASNSEMFFGILELMLGLFIGGALISIITELIANISSDIKNGYYPYKDKNHIIIINHNSKLEFILREINYYYRDLEEFQEVVLFLPLVKDIEKFAQNLPKYTNINIILLTGDELVWNSYKRLNINYAQTILILKDFTTTIKHLNLKISKYILSHKEFSNPNLDFIIESEDDKTMKLVYEEVFKGNKNNYSVIEHNSIVSKFLNRSIIEPDYFNIYSTLLSYEGYEFYLLDVAKVFNRNISFQEAYLALEDSILVGSIDQDGKLHLNPTKNMILINNDQLVTLQKSQYEYKLREEINDNRFEILTIPSPQLKTKRNICIVGDYDDIEEDQIIQFLSEESIKNMDKYILEDDNYTQVAFWDQIIQKSYDMVILNMEDDYEFILTLYLRNIYKSNVKFLNSLINIIHSPLNGKLLVDKKYKHNIILSEKLVGEYTTQVIFNHRTIDIFDELMQSKGNEFYILDKDRYEALFNLEYNELKINLIENNMIYIGAIQNEEFIIDCKKLNSIEKIVVLAEGI